MRIILSISLGILLISCAEQKPEILDITVAGKITNAKGDSIAFHKDDDVMKFAVDEEGNFLGKMDPVKGYYFFVYNRQYSDCYLNPGDSLHISFDANDFDDSMSYSGSSADVNNYLAARMVLNNQESSNLPTRELYSMSEDSFVYAHQSAWQRHKDFLENSDIDEAFKAIESKNIDYEFLSKSSNYEAYHQYFTKNDSFEVSDEFNNQFEDIDYTNEEDFASVPNYNSMVIQHFTSGKLEESLQRLEPLESDVIKEAVIGRLLNWLSPGTEDLLEKVNEMKAMLSNEELIAELDEKYESMKMLTKGNVSPGFELKNIDGDMVSLEDLKGKNVYIDVWATWCGPCKYEIPYLKTLEADYHGKNIEFVSISVDEVKDEQKWKDMVKEEELKGIQLISENGWNTEFVQNYLIRGIPRFILLDGEGNIVSADAPRPSSGTELTGMIDELI